MDLGWLHVSDFHFRSGDTYDSDVVLKALVASVRAFREAGRRCDLIFATGDIANAGQPAEYELATRFFDALLDAAKLDRSRLFVVPGNHDVDRVQATGLARTLKSREQSDAYFAPTLPKPHLTQKMRAYVAWYDAYFAGLRRLPTHSSCGPVELVQVRGRRIAVLNMNSALFCEDDNDHANLFIGRRCLEQALDELDALGAHFSVALLHHPLDWLSDIERSNIKGSLQDRVDAVLRGHLHETDVDIVTSLTGTTLHFAAGASYQTRRWPNRALYVTMEDDGALRVFPIRYEDSPRPVWTVDPSVYPRDPGYERRLPNPRARADAPPAAAPRAAAPAQPQTPARFRSNVFSRGDLPFLGRDDLLADIARELGPPTVERVVVLHGPPGVGKSELAREYARRTADLYPGGRFFIDAGAELVDLARIGANALGLEFAADLPLSDRCEQTMLAMHGAATLLIYDNPPSKLAIEEWLPRSGMACHAIVTTVNERWCVEWPCLPVPPLSNAASLDLVEKLGGPVVAERFGRDLAALAGGLPVQLVPASRALAYEERRGRLDAARLDMTPEASGSFDLVFETLDASLRLLLYAAAYLAPQRIVANELFAHMGPEYGGARPAFQKALDACYDLHLLEGGAEMRMHQLLGAYLRRRAAEDASAAASLQAIRQRQKDSFMAIAWQLIATPADAERVGAILSYRLPADEWNDGPAITASEAHSIGQGLLEIGRFDEARSWYERAAKEREHPDEQGRVDHTLLSASLHSVGLCLSSTGRPDEARPWLERAVKEAELGNVDGVVDHDSLGASLHALGHCLAGVGKFTEAQPLHERAARETECGNLSGVVDHESLSKSLHSVGFCLSSCDKFEEALPWFQRAVQEAELGDSQGRVDHDSVGLSLLTVGHCLARLGKFDEARSWHERAIREAEQGDVHGRVDHDTVGSNLHWIGECWRNVGNFAEALPWFERAVQERELGDVHGRIDHEEVSSSLHAVGNCLYRLDRFEEARPWFEGAVRESDMGDVYGRIDHQGLGRSLHALGICIFRLGKFEEALPQFERAVSEKEQVDDRDPVDDESLRSSVEMLAQCCRDAGRLEDAAKWDARLAAMPPPVT